MSADMTKQLQGTRAEVQSAAKEIDNKFKQYMKRGLESVLIASQALTFELQVLRRLCLALQANCHQHADIYCDIVASMLPHAQPSEEKPVLWDTHLGSLRYIHGALCREQSTKECQRFYALTIAQPCRLQSETDYKLYFNMHICHFQTYQQQLQKQVVPADVAHAQLYKSLEALGALFDCMRQQKRDSNFNYAGLMGELNQMLLAKRSSAFLKFLSSLPAEQTSKMFEPLFRLLSCNTLPATELSNQLTEQLSAFLALLQLDMFTLKLEQQLALSLLRSCRDLFKLTAASAQHYNFQLLYYYVKLLYVREAMPDFKRHYIDICQKFVSFFGNKGAAHAKEQWFMDLLVTLQRLQCQLHESSSKAPPFDCFWQQLEGEGGAAAYAAHFQLLQSSIEAAAQLSSSSIASSSCNSEQCKSLSKHSILSLGLCGITAYSNCPQLWQAKANEQALASLQQHLCRILRYSADVAARLKCLGPASNDLIKLMWHLANSAGGVSNKAHFNCQLQLVLAVQPLRALFAPKDLLVLLRRLSKAASGHCERVELAAQLQAAFMAAISCPSRQRQHFIVYYRGLPAPQQCVYELHEQSPLRQPLTETQRRRLFELDLATVLTYNRSSVPLLQSLLRCCQSDYHFVLLARHMRQDKAVLQQLDDQRSKLRRMAFKQPLSRLEQLVASHATVAVLLDTRESQKVKIPVKETVEDGLEALLIKYNRLDMQIGHERRLVDLATAAVEAFKAFFNKADAEPISSDEALIDWEALLNDATELALALTTMGYMAQADEAWLLLLRISRLLEDRFSYLRAASHMLSRADNLAIEFDLRGELPKVEQMLDELWPQLRLGGASHLFKRHETLVLLCLCHLANYYARLDRPGHAQLLLLHVETLRNEFAERRGKCDIVLLNLQTVRFRLLYQRRRCRPLPTMPTALRVIDSLVEGIRNFCHISSVDAAAFLLLLCDLVRECAECTANRLSERLNIIPSLMNTTLQLGLALRSIEVLISWMWTNLQMESLDKAQSKLRLIEHLLGVKPLRQLSQPSSKSHSHSLVSKEQAESKQLAEELVGKMLMMHLHQGAGPGTVEPIRKQNQLTISTNVESLTSPTKLKLLRYVGDGEEATLRDSPQLRFVYFIVGCLHARLYYLSGEHEEELGNFYELANKWLRQQGSSSCESFGHMLLVQRIYQANYLRSKQKHQEAIGQVEAALASIGNIQQTADINYQYNLLLQLRATQWELQPKHLVLAKAKKVLRFNNSPEEKPIAAAVAKVKAVGKKTSKFQVYTEPPAGSHSSPEFISSSSPSASDSEQVNLNACQLIEISDSDAEEEEEEAAPLAPLLRTKSVPAVGRRAQRKLPSITVEIVEAQTPVAAPSRATRLKRCKSVEPGKQSETSQEKEKEAATSRGRGRPRRQNTVAAAAAVPEEAAVSTRRRQRN